MLATGQSFAVGAQTAAGRGVKQIQPQGSGSTAALSSQLNPRVRARKGHCQSSNSGRRRSEAKSASRTGLAAALSSQSNPR
ncbi:hypothetical protein LINPERPRIM_LOCUS14861, partial [Linum perenne]